MLVIPELGKRKQEDGVRSYPWLYRTFKASLGYVRPDLKKQKYEIKQNHKENKPNRRQNVESCTPETLFAPLELGIGPFSLATGETL